MKITFRIVALVFLCVCSAKAQTIVIKAGHLFDARSGKMLDNQIIIVRNRKIVDVGADLKYSKTDSVIDLSKSWVLPGLMDLHVHIGTNIPYRNVSIYESYATESSSFHALRASMVARQFLDNGFTTIKEIGNDVNYSTADVIRAIDNQWIQGPTIFYAGKIIAPYGGQSRGVNIEHEKFWEFDYIDADSHDEIRKAVRKNRYYGANVIKLVTGDNGIYDESDIKVAVDEAKKYGMKVTVHSIGGLSATNVINGGAAGIEHGFSLDDTQLLQMKTKGMFLVGTDFSFENWYAYGMDSAQSKTMAGLVADRLKRAYKIGTKMAFGTDIIIDLPGLNRVETSLKVLQSWKAAGIPPSYILQCMTINAAELLGADKGRGIIEKAFYADIIAVGKNPMDDIEAIKNVQFVMKEGKVVPRSR